MQWFPAEGLSTVPCSDFLGDDLSTVPCTGGGSVDSYGASLDIRRICRQKLSCPDSVFERPFDGQTSWTGFRRRQGCREVVVPTLSLVGCLLLLSLLDADLADAAALDTAPATIFPSLVFGGSLAEAEAVPPTTRLGKEGCSCLGEDARAGEPRGEFWGAEAFAAAFAAAFAFAGGAFAAAFDVLGSCPALLG